MYVEPAGRFSVMALSVPPKVEDTDSKTRALPGKARSYTFVVDKNAVLKIVLADFPEGSIKNPDGALSESEAWILTDIGGALVTGSTETGTDAIGAYRESAATAGPFQIRIRAHATASMTISQLVAFKAPTAIAESTIRTFFDSLEVPAPRNPVTSGMFVSPDGAFRLHSPGASSQEQERMDTAAGAIVWHVFKFEAPPDFFQLRFADLPVSAASNPQKLLNDATQGSLANASKLISTTPSGYTVQGCLARDYTAVGADDVVLRMLLLVMGNRIYMLTAAVEKGRDITAPRVTRFFESFELIAR
jgi:hypothetical protein